MPTKKHEKEPVEPHKQQPAFDPATTYPQKPQSPEPQEKEPEEEGERQKEHPNTTHTELPGGEEEA